MTPARTDFPVLVREARFARLRGMVEDERQLVGALDEIDRLRAIEAAAVNWYDKTFRSVVSDLDALAVMEALAVAVITHRTVVDGAA